MEPEEDIARGVARDVDRSVDRRIAQDIARGIAQVEGHLLWSAEMADIRRQAVRFTAQLPWLTSAQRADVERVYVTDRAAVSRAILLRVRERALALRGEYGERYARLRARCVAWTVAAVGATIGLLAAVTLLAR